MKNMKFIEKVMKLEPNNVDQYCSKEIAEFKHNNETMTLTLMLWRTDNGIEGMYTIAYECCDPEFEKGISFAGKSTEEICNWITEFQEKYHTKNAVLDLLKS